MSDRTGKPRWLRCACCDGDAGKFVQWYNQDDGYGLCARCADWIAERDARKPPEWRTDLVNVYGHPGTHRAPGRHETAQQEA